MWLIINDLAIVLMNWSYAVRIEGKFLIFCSVLLSSFVRNQSMARVISISWIIFFNKNVSIYLELGHFNAKYKCVWFDQVIKFIVKHCTRLEIIFFMRSEWKFIHSMISIKSICDFLNLISSNYAMGPANAYKLAGAKIKYRIIVHFINYKYCHVHIFLKINFNWWTLLC